MNHVLIRQNEQKDVDGSYITQVHCSENDPVMEQLVTQDSTVSLGGTVLQNREA